MSTPETLLTWQEAVFHVLKAGDVKQGPAQKSEKDAPPSAATTGAGPSGAPKAPSMSDKNSIHQSAGDRDSRDFPKKH